ARRSPAGKGRRSFGLSRTAPRSGWRRGRKWPPSIVPRSASKLSSASSCEEDGPARRYALSAGCFLIRQMVLREHRVDALVAVDELGHAHVDGEAGEHIGVR